MAAAAKKRTKSPTQARRARLLALLATGEFHSGERLAKRLRISRGGIWKLIRSLQAMGINIESVPRQGYRFPRAVDLLDRNAILAQMSSAVREVLDPLEVLLTVDSTNRYVAENAANPPGTTHVCVAEIQNAGRGRRGRSWVAPFGCGICMSMSWQFVEAPPTFSALSLAVGVAAVRDLYGTVLNEGANKGILVTTSDYGPDAYTFAKGKPLTLMNGANLLHMLEKHGHRAKIDIKAARELR